MQDALLYEWLQRSVKDRGNGAATALVYRDTYLSFRGLAHRVDRRAQELVSYGIGRGDLVGVMLGNVPDFVVLALAISKLEAVFVPIDPTTGARDLDMILEGAPLRALVTRPRGGDGAGGLPSQPAPRRALRPYQPKFVPESRRRLQGTLLNFNLFARRGKPLPGEAEVVLSTSDVGGDPKGVVRSPRELAAVARAIGETLGLDGSERTLALCPLHHAYGFDLGLCASLAHGSTLFIDDESEPRWIAKALRDQNIDVFPANPALYAALGRFVTARPLDPGRGRFLSSGSALLPAVAEAFEARFKVSPLSCYHTTETGPVSIDVAGKTPMGVGSPFAGVELRIADQTGKPLAAGTSGGVWVRSEAVARAFVPELTLPPSAGRAAIGRSADEGWFRTGDRGRLSPSGSLELDGREDDMVKVEGKRVALGEIAGCLEGFAQVRAAEARVARDDAGAATVVARVVRVGDCRAEDLIDHCARHLAPYKVPRQIEFCEDLG